MTMFGAMEVQYYQLTPIGVSRVQSGRYPERLSVASRQVMRDIAELGGTVEWDELKMKQGANPQALGTVMKRLVDLGYVTPVTMPQQEGGLV